MNEMLVCDILLLSQLYGRMPTNAVPFQYKIPITSESQKTFELSKYLLIVKLFDH